LRGKAGGPEHDATALIVCPSWIRSVDLTDLDANMIVWRFEDLQGVAQHATQLTEVLKAGRRSPLRRTFDSHWSSTYS